MSKHNLTWTPAPPDDPIFSEGPTVYSIPPEHIELRRKAMKKREQEKTEGLLTDQNT